MQAIVRDNIVLLVCIQDARAIVVGASFPGAETVVENAATTMLDMTTKHIRLGAANIIGPMQRPSRGDAGFQAATAA